jgi:hypothetical protein
MYVCMYVLTYLCTFSALKVQLVCHILETNLGVRHVNPSQPSLDHTVTQTRHQSHVAIRSKQGGMLITVLVEGTVVN